MYENARLARTNAEAHIYMDLHPCACGEAAFVRHSSVIELPDGLGAKYTGECAHCGAPREFVFRLTQSMVVPGDDSQRFGCGAGKSDLLDPGEWLFVADRYAQAADGSPQSRSLLATAIAALSEVLMFVDRDSGRVPRSAIVSERGNTVYSEEPGRFDAGRLRAVQAAYADFASAAGTSRS